MCSLISCTSRRVRESCRRATRRRLAHLTFDQLCDAWYVPPTRVPTLRYSTLSDRVATTSGGSRGAGLDVCCRRPRTPAHAHAPCSLSPLSRSRDLSRAIRARASTHGAARALFTCSLSLTRGRPCLVPSLTSRPRSHRRRRRWCRRCRRSRSRLRRSRHRSRRCGDGCPHPWLG